jgi:hypothetical protein
MAKKPRGHRANKPNDSFGTVNDQGLYRGKYREGVYDDEDSEENQEELTAQEAQEEDTSETATPQETEGSFAPQKAEQDSPEYKKRYDDLKRHYDKKLKEWQEKEDDYVSRLMTTSSTPAPDQESGLDLESFKERYPDVYNAIHKISSTQSEARMKTLEEELSTIRDREKALEKQKAYQELLRIHPDFDELKGSSEFSEWLDGQPKSISDGVYNNATDAKWASRVVDLYKADTGLTKKPARTRKKDDAAMAVSTPASKEVMANSGNKRVWKASEIGKMKPWEFEKAEAELDAARAEGRIDYNN